MATRIYYMITVLLIVVIDWTISKPAQVMFLNTPSLVTVDIGSTAILQCRVSHLQNRQVIWRKAENKAPLSVGNETFYNNNRIVVEHKPDLNMWNLVIHEARLTDGGVYECQVSSQFRHLRNNVVLTVRDTQQVTTTLPRPDIKITGSSYVERNGVIYLICNATGLEHSPDDLDWFFDGNKLSTTNRKVSIRKFMSITARTIVSILEIKEAELKDSGTYVCRSSNLQIQSMRVNVLNAGKSSVRREKTDEPNASIADSQTKDSSGGRNSARGYLSQSHKHSDVFITVLIAILCYNLFPS